MKRLQSLVPVAVLFVLVSAVVMGAVYVYARFIDLDRLFEDQEPPVFYRPKPDAIARPGARPIAPTRRPPEELQWHAGETAWMWRRFCYHRHPMLPLKGEPSPAIERRLIDGAKHELRSVPADESLPVGCNQTAAFPWEIPDFIPPSTYTATTRVRDVRINRFKIVSYDLLAAKLIIEPGPKTSEPMRTKAKLEAQAAEIAQLKQRLQRLETPFWRRP